MAIHCNRRGVFTDLPHTSFFSCRLRTLHDVHSHHGSRMCLCASHHTHGHPCCSIERLLFDSLFLALFLSVCLSYSLLFSSQFFLYSVLDLFFHVDNAKAINHGVSQVLDMCLIVGLLPLIIILFTPHCLQKCTTELRIEKVLRL